MINRYQISSVSFIEIITKNLKVTLCDFGASIYSIYFDDTLMTQTLVNEKDFLNSGVYHGKTIGRTANRIKGTSVYINNKEYKLMNNDGENTLHGGVDGLSSKFFKYETIELEETTKVIFSYLSKDNEAGFPGNLLVKVTYEIGEDSIKCSYEATSDQDTMCNLTNHAFFILGEKNLEKLECKINASNYLLTGVNDLLPIEKREVFKEIDFRKFKAISEDINSSIVNVGKAKGYDHNFYLDNCGSQEPQIFLRSPKYLLSISTDFECCQIYSDNYEDEFEWKMVDKGIRRSLAIEPQDDFLNRKVLKKDEHYHRYIKYVFCK